MKAYYVGFAGDGHLGRLNITHQFYQAFGEDDFNGISGQPSRHQRAVRRGGAVVRQGLVSAARELRLCVRATAIRMTTRRKGFDAILDNPNIAGGPFSFWNRQGIRLAQTGRRPRRPQQRAAVAAQQQDRRPGQLRQSRRARCSTSASTPS